MQKVLSTKIGCGSCNHGFGSGSHIVQLQPTMLQKETGIGQREELSNLLQHAQIVTELIPAAWFPASWYLLQTVRLAAT
jgi:hypothetical protein